jgi:hypothetical protein
MSFGLLPIQTHIAPCHLISYIQITLGSLGTTYGRGSRHQSIEMGTMMQQKLIDSMLLVLSMLKAANSMFSFSSGLVLHLASVG